MIIKKYWHKYDKFRNRRNYMGIFLFGILPIYIVCSDKV
jgi:hypothetical protein